MAGPIAGEAFWPVIAARVADEALAEQALSALPPRHRELLSDLETSLEPVSSDEAKALGLAHVFAGRAASDP